MIDLRERLAELKTAKTARSASWARRFFPWPALAKRGSVAQSAAV